MSLEITNVQNFLFKDSNLLKLLLVALRFGSQTFICGFSRQNICSVGYIYFKKFLQRRTRPPKFSKLNARIAYGQFLPNIILYAAYSRFHQIGQLGCLRGPLLLCTALPGHAACLCNITRRVMDIRRVQQDKVYF